MKKYLAYWILHTFSITCFGFMVSTMKENERESKYRKFIAAGLCLGSIDTNPFTGISTIIFRYAYFSFFVLFSLPFYETHGIRICSIRSRFILHWNLLKFSFAWFSIYCSFLSNRITDPMNDFRCEENIYRYRSHINFYDKIHWKPVPLLSSPSLCALYFRRLCLYKCSRLATELSLSICDKVVYLLILWAGFRFMNGEPKTEDKLLFQYQSPKGFASNKDQKA